MAHSGIASSRTLRRVLIALGAAVVLAAPAGIAAADETQEVPLHNINAPTESGENCPNDDDDFWHFIATPGSGNFAFVSITIVAGEPPVPYLFTGADIIVPGNSNNVFVKVPDGVDPFSIQLDGSFALISPDTPEAKFVLSHYCDGTTTTTTTTTTTSTTTSTTSTTSTTTTTMPTTTTTSDPGTTTTSTEPATTTSTTPLTDPTTTSTTPLTDPTTTSSTVAQLPPVGPTTTALVAPTTGAAAPPAPELPATGSDSAGRVAVAAAAVLGAGLAIVAASRRRGTVEG